MAKAARLWGRLGLRGPTVRKRPGLGLRVLRRRQDRRATGPLRSVRPEEEPPTLAWPASSGTPPEKG